MIIRSFSHLVISFVLSLLTAQAAIQPNALFSDHMVLQRGMPIQIWGTASEGEKITVELKGANGDLTDDRASAFAMNGKWQVKLPKLPAGGPYTLTITGDDMATDDKVQINDVLVGEVWLCSGQSNMERQLGPRPPQPDIVNWQQEIADANHDQIRQYYVHQTKGSSDTPAASVPGSWSVCSPQTAADFTAVGYFFARDLQKVLNVPIGIIHSSWGGTPIKAWTSHDAMQSDPDLNRVAEADEEAAKNPAAGGWLSSVLYNGMIAPLEPYTIRGVIWYQGESDAGQAKLYQTNLPVMIADWRKAWGEGDVPFLIVQIAPCALWDPGVREAQLLTWKKTPNTAMVVTTDIDSADMHPPHKQVIGARLCLAAQAVVFGQKIEYSGPVYESVDYEGNQAVLHFSHLGGGLVAKGGDLKGFEISGDGKNFVPARAEIQGDTVMVSADQVSHPESVRFGWKPIPDDNLFNKEGLPASPFCTDPE
jgi:sialate O-acetylesterase